MPDLTRVQELLDELLDREATPEEVCAECPELLPVVCERWREICRMRDQLDALLPVGLPRRLPTIPSGEPPLAEVPGYEIQAVLGRGGMGVVFKARHLRLKRIVALKMTLAGAFAGARERERFQREAELVAALGHPNVVQIHDVSEFQGKPFFTMEYLEGGSLSEKLAGAPLPVREAAAVLAPLAEAVHAAHSGGIVHRDLKPSNVLLSADGTPKISDFGLARRLGGEAGLTHTGACLGTPSYMAPEQARGLSDAAGPAADIYALGAILYEMLTGRPPFRAESAAETVDQLLNQEPVSPSQLNGSVPRAMETVCLMCLRKEPERRYASAAELAADLRRFLRHEPILAKPPGPVERLSHWIRRHQSLAASLSAVAVLLLVLAIGSLSAMLHFRDLGIKDRDTAFEMGRLADANGQLASRFQRERQNASDAKERVQHLYEQSEERGTALRHSLYAAGMNLCGQSIASSGGISRIHHWLMPWKDSQPDLRGWEWFYLYGLCHRALDSVSLTDSGLWSLAVSPDGGRLAAAGDDHSIYLMDTTSRTVIHRLNGHGARVCSVAWKPDGSSLASACWDGSLKTWDAATGQEQRTYRNQDQPLYSVAWSQDGTRLAAAGERTPVWVWDITTGDLVHQLNGHNAGVRGVAWHPSENRVASAGMDATVHVWDLNEPEKPVILKGHANWVNGVAWHPEGSKLASASNDRTCAIWNASDGTVALTLAGHLEGVLAVGWSTDGTKLATCGEDQTVRIWSAENGQELAALAGHTSKVTSVNWCQEMQELASSSHDGTVKFWSAAARTEAPRLKVDGMVNALTWSPDSSLIAESPGKGPLKLLDPTHRKSPIVLGGNWTSRANSWAPDGSLLASGGLDPAVHVWDVASGVEVRTLPGKVEHIDLLAWSHHGSTLAAVDEEGNIFVWNTESGALLRTMGDRNAYCFAIAWSPDDRRLASAWSDSSVRVDDVKTGKQILNMSLHTEAALSVAWSRNGKSIASAGGDSLVHICDAATGARKQTLHGHTAAVMSIAWHPDGDRLASASSDRSVRVWDPETGILMLSFFDVASQMTRVAWSPDGKSLATGSEDGFVTVYEAATGRNTSRIGNSQQ